MIHHNNAGIEAMRDELLHLETIGRLPRMDYNKGAPDFTAVMSGRCAIKERLDADFSRFFLPSPPVPVRDQTIPNSTGAGSSSSEDDQ